MISPVRSRFSAVLFLFFLLFSRELLAPTSEVIKQIAARNLAHFLLLKSLMLLEGPFFLAIDGPPGGGKSSLAEPLKEFIAVAVGHVGRSLVIGTFRQDAFLRSRGDRAAEFTPEHGPDGVSGNCDKREYRWPAIRACAECVHCGKSFWGYEYKPGEVPDIQGPKLYDYSELDILVFEGTHSTGNDLFPYMHATLYLGARPDLIRFNRMERGFVREKRRWDQCQTMANVAESQYPRCIHPNSQRAQYLFELVADSPLPEVNESLRDSWPEVSRTLTVVYTPFSHLIELSSEQKKAMEKLRQSGVLADVNGVLEESIFAAPPLFWNQLTDLFQGTGFQLNIPARDHSCFFSALASAYKMLGIRNREEALALLRRLQEQLQQGTLTGVQQQVMDQVHAILSLEIDFISDPQHWGGFTTLMYLWAALLGSDNPPTGPVYLVLRLGVKIVILKLNPDGTVEEIDNLPASGNVLVYDGGTHWMWAEHNVEVHPENVNGFAHQTSIGSTDNDDSGFSSPMNSLSQLPGSDGVLVNALNLLLIQTMTKILSPPSGIPVK